MNDMKIDDILRNCVEDLTKALNESRGKIERLEAENVQLQKQLKGYEETRCSEPYDIVKSANDLLATVGGFQR
jgi:hypothetical protein